MPNNILDHFEEKEEPIYSNISFKYFLVGLGGFFLFVLLFDNISTFFFDKNLQIISNLLFLFPIAGISFYGLFNGVKSQKEKNAPFLKKYIGLYGNALLFGILLVMIINMLQLKGLSFH